MTRQALYHHFTTKDEILVALFDRIMSNLESDVARVDDPTDPQRFIPMVAAHALVVASEPELSATSLHERNELNRITGHVAGRRRQVYSERFTRAYRDGTEASFLRTVPAPIAANMVIASANSITWWYRPTKAYPPVAVVKDFTAAIRDGYLNEAPST